MAKKRYSLTPSFVQGTTSGVVGMQGKKMRNLCKKINCGDMLLVDQFLQRGIVAQIPYIEQYYSRYPQWRSPLFQCRAAI